MAAEAGALQTAFGVFAAHATSAAPACRTWLGKTTSEMEAARLASSASATQRSRSVARAIAALRADGCAVHDTARTAVYAGASDPGDPDRTAARFAFVRYQGWVQGGPTLKKSRR